ncbi:MAG: DUF4097 family beta strand repeat protein [Spirochaetales bacterium]|nr:DUF4097 family beta strand repeat protein [Spirochaetales bacterium]
MNAREYLEKLSASLGVMEGSERDDFVREMESHIDDLRERHPESTEEELVSGLVAPEDLADELLDGKGAREKRGGDAGGAGGDETPRRPRRGRGGLSGLGARLREALGTIEEKLDHLDIDLDFDLDLGRSGPRDDERYAEGELEKVFPGEGLEAIDLKALSAEIRVLPSTRAEARFVARGKRGSVDFSFETDGGELSIIERPERGRGASEITLELPASLDRARVVAKSGDVTLEGVDCDLEVETTSGDVSARSCAGGLSVVTLSGDVEVEECGTLAVRTASGDIRAEGIAGSAAARSASGDIVLERVGGDAAGESASGSVGIEECGGRAAARAISGDVDVSGAGGPVTVGASSGSVELDCTRGFAGAEISTVSGDVSVDLPSDVDALVRWSTVSGDLKMEGGRGRRGELVLGGGGPALEIKTASGDIQVDW